MQPPLVDQLLADECLRGRAAALGDVADAPAHRDRRAAEIVSGDDGVARARGEQRREHPQRRRLAGAVGAEEADDLACIDVDVDAANGLDSTRAGGEALGQPARLDHIVKFEHIE